MRVVRLESLRLKIRNILLIPVIRQFRRYSQPAENFTIISNNCWAGTVYESYGLRKNSPTVGMFVMPEDYLKLLSDLRGTLSIPLEFISPDESKWRNDLSHKSNWGTYLIGRIGDIELHMLHYHDEHVARQKWESRTKRVNFDSLIVKFNDQNGCTFDQAKRFDALNYENKIFFTVGEVEELRSGIRVRAPKKHRYVKASYEPILSRPDFKLHELISNLVRK